MGGHARPGAGIGRAAPKRNRILPDKDANKKTMSSPSDSEDFGDDDDNDVDNELASLPPRRRIAIQLARHDDEEEGEEVDAGDDADEVDAESDDELSDEESDDEVEPAEAEDEDEVGDEDEETDDDETADDVVDESEEEDSEEDIEPAPNPFASPRSAHSPRRRKGQAEIVRVIAPK